MSFEFYLVLLLGFSPLWFTCQIFFVLMFLNRKPGTDFVTIPIFKPQYLTERGLWFRKSGLIVLLVGLAWILGGVIVGELFHL